jgi:hypothetical protein
MVNEAAAAVTVTVTGMETLLAPEALTEMVPVWVPAASALVVAVTVIVPVLVPEAGLSRSHVAVVVAVQFKVPPPLLLIRRGWAGGLLPLCWAVKDTRARLVRMAGGTVTVTVTGTETLLAPEALTEMVPVWVPAASALVVAVTVMVPVLAPEAGLSRSHVAVVVAVQFKVPPPRLLMCSVLDGGLAAPC